MRRTHERLHLLCGACLSVDPDGPSTPCGLNSCYHGGQCSNGSEPYCLCADYYSGPNCTEFNGKSLWRMCARLYMLQDPLQLLSMNVPYHMKCLPQCSGIDVCFCRNGGFYSNYSRSCYCPEGFGGIYCERDYRHYLCKLQHATLT